MVSKKWAISLLVSVLFCSGQASMAESTASKAPSKKVVMPLVPKSVVTSTKPNPPKKEGKVENKPVVIAMRSGVNEIVPVAINHLNRVVTPFPEPEITTMSEAQTQVRENVVYVGPQDEYPVTLFITNKGSQSQALSLTLVPQKIPPQELFLTTGSGDAVHATGFLGNTAGSTGQASGEGHSGAISGPIMTSKRAERWERQQPFVLTIRKLMRSIALGEIPPGYTMAATSTVPNAPLPRCEQNGLRFDFKGGQSMFGGRLNVMIGKITNVSDREVEFKEQSCSSWQVAAVAAWPEIYLKPGQKTEVYVAQRQGEATTHVKTRPSLLF